MKILVTAHEIDQRIAELAKEITQTYQEARPLFVCLLRGAAPFASKLMFEISREAPDFHPELDYMTVSTYGDGRIGGESRVLRETSPNTNIAGRTVIVLDDVLDKGITARFCNDYFISKGASTVDLVVLAEKATERSSVTPKAKLFGFHLPDAWLVGMGMDDTTVAHEGQRWLDYIAVAND